MPRDTPYAGVAAIFASAPSPAGRAPQVFEDGGQLRDFVHVRDVARANVLALTAPEPVRGAFNVCSGTPRTIGDMAPRSPAGGPAPQVTGRFRLGDVRHVFADRPRARGSASRDRDFEARMPSWLNRMKNRHRAAENRVLVVDDEPTIGEVVSRYLERAGYATRVAEDGLAALDAVAARAPDLIVLDLMLPGLDGLEVMRRRAREDRAAAIILLTAKGEESDRIVGLRLGADDYVVKPFSPAELVARVDAVLRRVDTVGQDEPPLRFGRLEIDPTARRCASATARRQLTAREYDLLLFLARHPGRAFTRDS